MKSSGQFPVTLREQFEWENVIATATKNGEMILRPTSLAFFRGYVRLGECG